MEDVEGEQYLIKGQLIIDYDSTIVPIVKEAQVRRPDVAPPTGLILLKPIDYLHDKSAKIGKAPIPVSRKTREDCTIVYGIQNGCQYPITDEHRWRCPVEDFQLTADLPKGRKFHASLLRKYPPDAAEVKVDTVWDKALFSQQGFRWSIG